MQFDEFAWYQAMLVHIKNKVHAVFSFDFMSFIVYNIVDRLSFESRVEYLITHITFYLLDFDASEDEHFKGLFAFPLDRTIKENL